MSAAEVIESVDVFEEGNFDLPAGLPVSAPNHFRLKGFEKALDSSVVVAISLSTHGRGQAGRASPNATTVAGRVFAFCSRVQAGWS